jgi:hypothetical protein
MDLTIARRMWTLLEPLHVVTYFAPHPRAAFEAAGLRGFWRGYFAGRAAPLGPVGPGPVTALFYGFAPAMVARALPSVWGLVTPDIALTARLDGAVAALTEARSIAEGDTGGGDGDGDGGGGGGGGEARLVEALDLARAAVDGVETGGRALGAANAGLPWPDGTLAGLWHAATVLREVRGDGHVAALLTAGLSGLDALVLRAGKDLDRPLLQSARGWTDDAWANAEDALRTRGLLDVDASITDAGRELLRDVEAVTDHLATQPWRALGDERTQRLAELVEPLARAAARYLPATTPIGLPAPGG